MQRLPEQDIYVYQAPGEEIHKILVGDLDQKRLKAFSKVDTASGQIIYKIIAEDAKKNTETLAEGSGTSADFEREVSRLAQQYLEPVGEAWREVQPKLLKNFDPHHPCPKQQ
ncbi:hypothetical protein [Desulforamulus ferrireducens]|uniref:Uncharacterized protein n=1 Tax=Desulforamulus ferrireducens TaxID=1833852 RepID=A0A1S6IZH1_9FIRM|nr:hypothetical protein [Desulforamulus ferrireducens]AQS60172.1 hypothetical protein B0537_14445 [Desulforamulus ferrireducens]